MLTAWTPLRRQTTGTPLRRRAGARGLPAVLALVAGLAGSGGAVAQGGFNLPDGCTGVLTIQNRGCLLTNVWTCEGEPEGLQWVALFDERGPFQVKQVDPEFQWLTTYYTAQPRIDRMAVPAPDPASLEELFATGFDSYDFTVVPEGGMLGPMRYVGFDRLTGETVIDGEPLMTTEYGFERLGPDGSLISRRAGRQFVSDRHRIFILGESWNADAPDEIQDHSPVDFIYPGEPGFMPAQPIHDCGVMMSAEDLFSSEIPS